MENNNQEVLASVKQLNEMLYALTQKNIEADKKYDGLLEITRKEMSEKMANIVADVQQIKLANSSKAPSFETGTKESTKTLFNFLRKGNGGGADDKINFALQTKDLTVGDAEQGGYLAYQPYGRLAIAIQRLSSPLRQYANVASYSGGGDTYPILRWLNNSTAGYTTESTTNVVSNANTGEVRIPINELTVSVPVSMKLLEDSYNNIEEAVVQEIYRAFVELESNLFINGLGVNTPMGILSEATTTTEVTGGTKAFLTVNSGGATTYTKAGISNIFTSLKQGYWDKAKWFSSRSALAELFRLSDVDNLFMYPLPNASNASGSQLSLYGKEVVVLEHLPVVAAGSKSLIYGSMEDAYTIVDKPIQTILRDPYSTTNFINYKARKRSGGHAVAYDALVLLNTSA
jgi:HK97 family phage major capsid protein